MKTGFSISYKCIEDESVWVECRLTLKKDIGEVEGVVITPDNFSTYVDRIALLVGPDVGKLGVNSPKPRIVFSTKSEETKFQQMLIVDNDSGTYLSLAFASGDVEGYSVDWVTVNNNQAPDEIRLRLVTRSDEPPGLKVWGTFKMGSFKHKSILDYKGKN
ncbi:MAG: hypothetical protein AAGD96_23600 [Chloroflexota bacterium]